MNLSNQKYRFNILIFIVILLSFQNNLICAEQKSNLFPEYTIIGKRNIFRSLWKTSESIETNKTHKDDLDAIKKIEEERKETEKKQAEQKQIDEKKKEIENNFVLTGIIAEGSGVQAIIQNKSSLNKTFFLKEGEVADGLKVTSINESKGEVILEYQGKLSISLHLE